MPYNVYPTTPKPTYAYVLDHQFRTLITDFESGEEQRNRRWRFPKRTFLLFYKTMAFTTLQRDAVYEFMQNRSGPYEPFWFFDFQERKWVDQYVGQGDGSEDTFDIPGMNTGETEEATLITEAGDTIITESGDTLIAETLISPIVYVDGTATTEFTFNKGIGEGGADQIKFNYGHVPSAGQLITCDFTGLLRIKGRFKDDRVTEELFTKDLENISVSIYEIKN